MIYYAYDFERWEDTDDPVFATPMTPESYEDCGLTFETQAEFWRWFYNNQKDV